MSNEIQVRASLIVKKGSKPIYQSPSVAYLDNQSGDGGPFPGDLIITADGRDIYWTDLTTPGWTWLQNNEDPATSDVYVTFGIYDPSIRKFYPIGELGPGQGIPFKFTRDLSKDFIGSGTGSPVSGTYFRLEAHGTGPARFFIGAFAA